MDLQSDAQEAGAMLKRNVSADESRMNIGLIETDFD